MTFEAYLVSIKEKTGKTPDDFRALAKENGLLKSGEIVAWLKSDFGLGHGHANAIAHLLVHTDSASNKPDALLQSLFSGSKAKWLRAFERLTAEIAKFGSDVEIKPNRTYVNLLRGGKKFGLLLPASANHFDIGIKLAENTGSEKLERAGAWNSMVSHRLRVDDASADLSKVVGWLRQAYDEIAIRKMR